MPTNLLLILTFDHIFQIIEPVPFNAAIYLPAVALGIIGGILGAIFTRLNNAINLGRKQIVACEEHSRKKNHQNNRGRTNGGMSKS